MVSVPEEECVPQGTGQKAQRAVKQTTKTTVSDICNNLRSIVSPNSIDGTYFTFENFFCTLPR